MSINVEKNTNISQNIFPRAQVFAFLYPAKDSGKLGLRKLIPFSHMGNENLLEVYSQHQTCPLAQRKAFEQFVGWCRVPTPAKSLWCSLWGTLSGQPSTTAHQRATMTCIPTDLKPPLDPRQPPILTSHWLLTSITSAPWSGHKPFSPKISPNSCLPVMVRVCTTNFVFVHIYFYFGI